VGLGSGAGKGWVERTREVEWRLNIREDEKTKKYEESEVVGVECEGGRGEGSGDGGRRGERAGGGARQEWIEEDIDTR